MKALGIITARGGSKRIPMKNIKEFCGQPIIAYSINAALSSGVFDTVMVSTDDLQIAQVAKEYGAQVPFLRSEKTSDDFATTSDVILEVLGEYQSRGEEFDLVCCIYPTAPFVTADKLASSVTLMKDEEVESVLPVVRFSFPPQRSVVINQGYLEPKWPEYMPKRSQDLESFFHDVGQFYWLRVNSFLQKQKLIMDKTVPFELPELEVQDIDNEEDWKLAELKYRMMGK